MAITVSSKQQNMTQKYNQFRFRNSSLLTVHQLGVGGLRSLHLRGYNILTLTDTQTWHNWCVNWLQYNNIIVFPMLLASSFLKRKTVDFEITSFPCLSPSIRFPLSVGLHGNVQRVFGYIF